MTEFERFAEALNAVALAVGEIMSAMASYIKNHALPSVLEFAEADAYMAALLQHPKWVHMATYSKKKRTRKKYHDKIMRSWRAMR